MLFVKFPLCTESPSCLHVGGMLNGKYRQQISFLFFTIGRELACSQLQFISTQPLRMYCMLGISFFPKCSQWTILIHDTSTWTELVTIILHSRKQVWVFFNYLLTINYFLEIILETELHHQHREKRFGMCRHVLGRLVLFFAVNIILKLNTLCVFNNLNH